MYFWGTCLAKRQLSISGKLCYKNRPESLPAYRPLQIYSCLKRFKMLSEHFVPKTRTNAFAFKKERSALKLFPLASVRRHCRLMRRKIENQLRYLLSIIQTMKRIQDAANRKAQESPNRQTMPNPFAFRSFSRHYKTVSPRSRNPV